MITHNLTTKTKIITGFNRFSKFIVLGNNIDGYISIGHEEFKNWEDFTQRFPEMYRNIKFSGEWSLNIYQVPDDYKIKYQYGYFMVPNKGKMIADIGYMQIAGKQMEVFISNAMIHFQSRSIDSTENWDNVIKKDNDHDIDVDFQDTEVTEEFITILFHEVINGRTFSDEDYPGDSGSVHHEIYTQVYS